MPCIHCQQLRWVGNTDTPYELLGHFIVVANKKLRIRKLTQDLLEQ